MQGAEISASASEEERKARGQKVNPLMLCYTWHMRLRPFLRLCTVYCEVRYGTNLHQMGHCAGC